MKTYRPPGTTFHLGYNLKPSAPGWQERAMWLRRNRVAVGLCTRCGVSLTDRYKTCVACRKFG